MLNESSRKKGKRFFYSIFLFFFGDMLLTFLYIYTKMLNIYTHRCFTLFNYIIPQFVTI